jgi:hypothetical protein
MELLLWVGGWMPSPVCKVVMRNAVRSRTQLSLLQRLDSPDAGRVLLQVRVKGVRKKDRQEPWLQGRSCSTSAQVNIQSAMYSVTLPTT